MKANTLTSATKHAHKRTRDTILHTVNSIKDRQALAIQQEIKESRYYNDDCLVLM